MSTFDIRTMNLTNIDTLLVSDEIQIKKLGNETVEIITESLDMDQQSIRWGICIKYMDLEMLIKALKYANEHWNTLD